MKTIKILLLIIILLQNLYSNDQQVKEQNCFKQGLKLYTSGQYLLALEQFIDVLKTNPHNSQARNYMRKTSQKIISQKEEIDTLYMQGKIYFNEGRYLPAKECFIHVVDIKPKHSNAKKYIAKIDNILKLLPVHFESGRTHYQQGNFAEATKELNEVLKIDPTHSETLNLLASINKKLEEQLIEQERKEKIRLKSAEEWYKKSFKAYSQQNYLDTILYVQQSIKLNPDSEEANNLNKLVLKELNEDIAKEDLDSVIFRRVKDNYVQGIEYYKKASFDKACEEFEKVLKMTMHIKTHQYLNQAKQHLQEEKNREQAKLYFQQAELLNKENNFKDARENLIKTVQMDPDHLPGQELLEKINDRITREETIKECLNNGQKNYNESKYISALDDFQKILTIDPKNTNAHEWVSKVAEKIIGTVNKNDLTGAIDQYFEKGKIYFDKNDFDNALAEWAKVILLSPANRTAGELMRKAYQEKEKYIKEQKQRLIQQQEEQQKKDKKAKIDKYISEANSLASQGRHKDAIEQYKKILIIEPNNSSAKTGIDKSQTELNTKKEQQQVRAVDQELVDKYYKEGLILFNQGQFQKAIIEWKRVLELVPNHEKAKANIKTAEEKLR